MQRAPQKPTAEAMLPFKWLSICLILLFHGVCGLITQQDPSVDLTADPGRNHYFLSLDQQTAPATNTSASPARFAVKAQAAAAAAPTSSTGALLCGGGTKCIDGSCCGANNICGFGDTYCGDGCQSNCPAKAPCGRDSAGGSVSCGMNLCCSYYGWCGTTEVYCTKGTEGCQENFGDCNLHDPFQCDPGAASATKRTIGYYQGANIVSSGRKCQKVFPEMIPKEKYTHLNWAFANINSDNFQVEPSDPSDAELYTGFTKLQETGKLETWISIGGFDFTTNHPSAFTNMVSTSANRLAFIDSLVTFMRKYGFQGVDLDWEYPVDANRGGHPDDMKNLVQLLAEMRAYPAFGNNFGISAVLAPDVWYLQHYDARGLLDHADFIGFMNYDLHGVWDEAVPNVGKKVYGQTDISDIERDLVPLWFDLDPGLMSRVNVSVL